MATPHPTAKLPPSPGGRRLKWREIMNKTNNSKLTNLSRQLRTGMTKEERHLWYDFLKKLPVTIHRQKVLGNYIADFYCPQYQIVIELDGSQHYEDDAKEKDRIRDEYFNSLGITVLRYTNLQIHRKFDAVCNDILVHIKVYD